MKIKTMERVVYEHNPLVEVVCQLRFDSIVSLESGPPSRFSEDFASIDFPIATIEQQSSLQIDMDPIADGGSGEVQVTLPNIPAIYHFSSADKQRKISISANFISFSCARYEGWEGFRAAFLEVVNAFFLAYEWPSFVRLGLRYKDLIARENLGLEGTPWKELLSPLVSGIFAHENYFSGMALNESCVDQQVSQVLLRLDDCDLLLQSALLRSAGTEARQAFLIDADFFRESPQYSIEMCKLGEIIDDLHKSAGSIFRHCIEEKLHVALGPKPDPC
jgi:uncharacterized protein (TIGR04255 family)